MSTIALPYPNSVQLRRGSVIRWIILLIATLALVTGVILVVAASVKADTPSSASLSSVIAIPVPAAPAVDAKVSPTVTTAAPSPAVIAVPVPTPPSQ